MCERGHAQIIDKNRCYFILLTASVNKLSEYSIVSQ
jgi:hypothetical protein